MTSLDKLHFGFSNKCFHQGTICCVFFSFTSLWRKGTTWDSHPLAICSEKFLARRGKHLKKSLQNNQREKPWETHYLIDLIVNSSHFQWVWAHQAAIRPLKCSMVAQKARLGLVNMWPVKFSCPVWSALFQNRRAAAGCVSIPIWMPESFWRGESELKARTGNELDHWSDPSGTESNNVQLNQIIDVR